MSPPRVHTEDEMACTARYGPFPRFAIKTAHPTPSRKPRLTSLCLGTMHAQCRQTWWSAPRRWEHWDAPQSWQWRPNGSRKNASCQPRMSEPWCQAPARSNVVAPKVFASCDAFAKPAGTSAVTASVGPATPVTAKGNAQLSTLAPDPALSGRTVTVLCQCPGKSAI